MTGESEFNEVFLSDVRVSESARIGAEGHGWKIAQTTLANERGMYGSRGFGTAARGTAIGEALALWGTRDRHPAQEALRARIIQLWIDSKVLAWTNERVSGLDGVPAPVAKIAFARVQQRGFELCLDIMGTEVLQGALSPGAGQLFDGADARHYFLRSRANSIEGGSSEIMHNLIARRVLKMPSDDLVDRNTPWSQLARN
jgi:alkylation response protein AidB-like acyl-CoA dehydrogenase